MNVFEFLFGIFLAVALVGLAGYFACRQFSTRRALAQNRAMAPEERAYLIRQTRRRLICSILMVMFAAFLVGWFFIEPNLADLKVAAGEEPDSTPPLLELVAYYWIVALLLLFGIFALAATDFFATARYGMHQRKLLEIERRTALGIEASRLRNQRSDSEKPDRNGS